jgi:hypothetical protein
MALHSDNPGETGASNEVVGGSYARQNVLASFGAASAGQVQNDTLVEFTNMPAVTVMAISFWDAVTSGNCLWTGWLGGTPVSMFAANSTDDVFTAYAHGLIDTDRVTFEARDGGGLPTGISEGTVYFVRDAATNTFKVATTSGGTAIDLTASGEGAAIKVAPKTVANAGDTVRFAVAAITVRLD